MEKTGSVEPHGEAWYLGRGFSKVQDRARDSPEPVRLGPLAEVASLA